MSNTEGSISTNVLIIVIIGKSICPNLGIFMFQYEFIFIRRARARP